MSIRFQSSAQKVLIRRAAEKMGVSFNSLVRMGAEQFAEAVLRGMLIPLAAPISSDATSIALAFRKEKIANGKE